MNNTDPIKTPRGVNPCARKGKAFKKYKIKLSQSFFSKYLEIRKTKVDIYDIKHTE